ncbi:Uncharacterized protein LCER1_G008954 [Lachnellula cervina]|uniref:Uncharacterized protein n=1 Tax=Lachnellula cervina TaxID=1316786 RepID=A0A7D8Z3J5_9HELO|nr:Uncharacterized protein LCER1_G008954 [Lachnellula cervina]
MATSNPELQDKLQELEHELEKRRTILLSQFLGPSAATAELKGLRIHSPDNTAHPLNDGSRSASLAALNSNSRDLSEQYDQRLDAPSQPTNRLSSGRLDTMASDFGSFGNNRAQEGGFAQSGRPKELRLGIHNANPIQRQSSYGRDSLFLPKPGDMSAEPSMTDGSMASGGTNYAFNPAHQVGYTEQAGDPYESQAGTMMDSHGTMLGESQQGYFSDFAGQQAYDNGARDSYGGGPHRYSSSDAFSPTAATAPPMLTTSDLPPPAALEYQMPLEPRDVPFAVYDPHDGNTPMSKFDNIAAVLRHRSKSTPKASAYWILDSKGKEIASITWDKLTSRAEKVAQVIRDKVLYTAATELR